MSDDMKQDVEKLKSETADLRGTDKRIAIGLSRLEGKMDLVAKLIVDRVDKKLDRMTGQLDDHHSRLNALDGGNRS